MSRRLAVGVFARFLHQRKERVLSLLRVLQILYAPALFDLKQINHIKVVRGQVRPESAGDRDGIRIPEIPVVIKNQPRAFWNSRVV